MSSSFWADRLAGRPTAPPTVPALPAPAPAAVQPWWKTPAYHSAPAAEAPHSVQPTPGDGGQQLPAKLPPSARNSGVCPNCASGHYFQATPNTRTCCYDCGWPIQHSTSGAIATKDPGDMPTRAALGQSKSGGFRPDIIVGHV